MDEKYSSLDDDSENDDPTEKPQKNSRQPRESPRQPRASPRQRRASNEQNVQVLSDVEDLPQEIFGFEGDL